MKNENEKKKNTRKLLYSGGISLDPETQIYVSIFYDKFLSSPTRYKSSGGLYLTIMNQRLEDQRRLENISLLSLVPPGVAFGDVWEPFRKELVTLEIDGFKLFEEGKEINHHVRLAMFKADAPQRCENLDHVSVTAHNICPRCPKQKNDLWDWKEDLKIDHHRKGLLEAIEKLKDLIPEEDYHKVLDKLGFHGSNNLFQGMTFDAFLQTVCEVYHLLFLGIIKFYFRATVRSLAPWERDALNFMIKDFPFPRGTPRVTFDVTSSSKNFSMSTMALVIKALPHHPPSLQGEQKKGSLSQILGEC